MSDLGYPAGVGGGGGQCVPVHNFQRDISFFGGGGTICFRSGTE